MPSTTAVPGHDTADNLVHPDDGDLGAGRQRREVPGAAVVAGHGHPVLSDSEGGEFRPGSA